MRKRYKGSILKPAPISTNIVFASGVWPLEQQMQLKAASQWPIATGAPTFSISPSVSGKSTWNLTTDGALTLTTATTYTIVPTNDFFAYSSLWGAGGGGGYYNDSFNQRGNGGGGGFTKAQVLFRAGVTYYLVIGGGGKKGKNTPTGAVSLGGTPGNGGNSGQRNVSHGAAGGGGYTGVFKTSVTQGNSVLIAGGGGGGIGYPGAYAGAGGGSTGQDAEQTTNTGGTQSGGGSDYWSASGQTGLGTALQGGLGYQGTVSNQGDPGGGGGGGYYGGSNSGSSRAGGGGSGYILTADVVSGTTTTTTGNYRTPADTGSTGYVANVAYGGLGSSSAGATDMQDGYDGEIYISLTS